MKKLIIFCIVTSTLTTNNNILGMLRSIIHCPNNTQQLFKRMISRKSGMLPDGPYHRHYICDEGTSTKQLKNILKQNREITRSIRDQNRIMKQLIEINNTTLNGRMFVDDAVQLQQLENETYKLASRFNDLEKLVRP